FSIVSRTGFEKHSSQQQFSHFVLLRSNFQCFCSRYIFPSLPLRKKTRTNGLPYFSCSFFGAFLNLPLILSPASPKERGFLLKSFPRGVFFFPLKSTANF